MQPILAKLKKCLTVGFAGQIKIDHVNSPYPELYCYIKGSNLES